jgi:hypothetical protein
MGAAGVWANMGTAANASRPSQSVRLRFIFFSLGTAQTRLRANSKIVFAGLHLGD